MKYFFPLNSLKEIFIFVAIWRLLLFTVAIIATLFYTRSDYPFPYVDTILIPTGLPQWIWGFANFDGVHYIRTALWGYVSEYSQAFFPLFALLMRFLSVWNTVVEQKTVLLLSGLLISFLSTVGGFYFLRKVFVQVIPKKQIDYSLILIACFPTSFFFLSLYTESLFLLLASVSIYLMLKKKYLFAGIFIALATATKVIGIFLVGVYLIEIMKDLLKSRREEPVSDLFIKLFGLIIACSGIVLYMFYLFIEYNNPLYFINAQQVFGSGRQVDSFVLLPQVFFRYTKILLTVPFYSYLFFSSLLELLFSLFGLLLLIISFGKVRKSWWLFSLGAYILPTLTGTFTSMPRYVLMMFLLFPVFAQYTFSYRKILLPIFFVIQLLMCGLFVLGFWVA